ncbi:MAG: alpha/beta hydrolase [Bacteroidota bacterium]
MQQVEFAAEDGLLITADYYEVPEHKGLILLCHRSHANRAEYRETAPKFNALGYSCLAIDQRSGMKVFGEVNETKNRAKAQKLPTGFLDAKVDVEAGVNHAFQLNGNQPILLLGSSYSAALALLVATENEKVKAAVVFSPGEYLKGVNVADQIAPLSKPVYATSPQSEITQTEDILKKVKPEWVTQHLPAEEGFHGSKILWESVKGYEAQWAALTQFLDKT